jgi:chromosome partitioning protein
MTAGILDADPQGTALDWNAARETGLIPVVRHESEHMVRGLPDRLRSVDVLLIDTPGTLSGITVEAIKSSDVALVPTQPSASDLWAARDAIELVRERQAVTGGAPILRVVVSRGKVGTRLTGEAHEAIEAIGATPLPAGTRDRESYKRSFGQGQSVLASSDSKAKSEIRQITTDVLELLSTAHNEPC